MFRIDFPFAPFDGRSGVDGGLDCADPGVADCEAAAVFPRAGLGGGVAFDPFVQPRRPGLRGVTFSSAAVLAEDRAPGDGGPLELPLLPLKRPLPDLFPPPPDDDDLPNPFIRLPFGDLAPLPVTSNPSCMTEPGTGRSGPTYRRKVSSTPRPPLPRSDMAVAASSMVAWTALRPSMAASWSPCWTPRLPPLPSGTTLETQHPISCSWNSTGEKEKVSARRREREMSGICSIAKTPG